MTTATHHPQSAPAADDPGPRRALILAGGGMRVAYQAGVIRALIEDGYRFQHVDGTSGGIINLAMLYSGLTAAEMCDRWRSVSIRKFVSLAPVLDYLKLLDMPAIGDADGIVDSVFPHLGIEPAQINAARGATGTFNICDFADKQIVAVPHEEVTLDHLVAGISLPIFMPSVPVGDRTYTDAVWIQDANLMEAVRRGAEELWLVWCIGNTDEYLDGALHQYVHMIEMSAHGALFQEFEQVRALNARIEVGDSPFGHRSPISLHVIRPPQALPLDSDLYLGNIDTATLIDMGYRDASRYLEVIDEYGLPLDPIVTKAERSGPGITFRERMAGAFSLDATDPRAGAEAGEATGTELTMHATVHIHDAPAFIDDPQHTGELTGRIDFPPFGNQIPASDGVFNLFSPADQPDLKLMVYELAFNWDGQDYYLAGRKEVHDDPGFDLWSDTTTLFTTLHRGTDASAEVIGAGVLALSVTDLAQMIPTFRVTNASSPLEQAQVLARFGHFFMGELWDRYGPTLSWWRRLLRKLHLG